MAHTRISALDGARGVAAVGVLIHHLVLVWIPETRSAYSSDTVVTADPVAWLAMYTPLHLVWLGTANVFVFFALSGYVLVKPFLHEPRIDVPRFYCARFVRLYIPAWASLALALGVLAMQGAVAAPGLHPMSARVVLRDAALIPGFVSNAVNGVLWSLAWEVGFSLAVPVLLVWFRRLAVVARRSPTTALMLVITLPACLLAASVPTQGLAHDAAAFGFLFVTGASLAVGPTLLNTDVTTHSVPPWVRMTTAVLVPLGLCARWLALPFDPDAQTLRIADTTSVLAAAGVVAWILVSPGLRRVLSSRAALWTGTISFSLYLTHAPVIEAVHRLEDGAPWTVVVACIAVWPVAVLFRRFVESPAHRLARSIRRSGRPRRVAALIR